MPNSGQFRKSCRTSNARTVETENSVTSLDACTAWDPQLGEQDLQPSPCRPLPLPSQLLLVLTAPNPSAALFLPLPVPVAGSQQATFSLGSSQGLVLPLHSQAGSPYPSPPHFIPSLAGMGHSSALTVDCLLCTRVLLSCCLS